VLREKVEVKLDISREALGMHVQLQTTARLG
jgi:hypothetical protein